jgi:hypothetical protein
MRADNPGVLRWLYYAYGGGLPPRYAQWVLHDLTCRTWLLRHLSRALAQCAPSLLLLLLPGPLSLRLYMLALVFLGGIFISLSFAWEARNQRLYRHGFMPEMVLPRENGHHKED